MPVGRELGHVGIGCVPARSRHHLPHRGVPGLRTQDLCKVLEEAETVDNSIGLAILLDDRCNAAGAAGEGPCDAQLGIRTQAVEPMHHRLKSRRGIRKKHGRIELELPEHPYRLWVERTGACRDRIDSIPLA